MLQGCLWIICSVLDVEKVLCLMKRLLIQMESYGILNALCKNILLLLEVIILNLYLYTFILLHLYCLKFISIIIKDILLDAHNVSVHSQMEYSMNLKGTNIVNMISMSYLHLVVKNAVSCFNYLSQYVKYLKLKK